MKKINFKKGFTLIELLVVVAIVGLMASIVLVALNTARGKGGDAAIKANLAGIRSQAELIYSNVGCYSDSVANFTCGAFTLGQCNNSTANTIFANPTVWGQIAAAYAAGTASVASTQCYSSGSVWAVAVQLKSGGSNIDAIPDSWCVDSSGASKSYTWTAGQTIANSINVNICR